MPSSPPCWLAARLARRWVGPLALLVVPGLVRAAAPGDSTRGHGQFSLGLQAARFAISGIIPPTGGGEPAVFQGFFPTVGGQLSPRWHLEIAACWRHSSTPETTQIARNGDVIRSTSTSERFVVPILVRFSLLPHLPHWRVEALAGVVGVHARTDNQFSYTPVGQPVQPLAPASNEEWNDSPVLFGVGVTRELTPHWSIRGDVSANWSLMGSLLSSVLGGRSFAWQPGYGVGLQYTFAWPGRPRP